MSLQEYFNYNINISTSANLILSNCTIPNILHTNITTTSIISSGISNHFFNSNTLGNLFTTGGNIGINNTSPSYLLDVNGTSRISGQLTSTNTTPSTNQTTGAVVVSGGIGVGGAIYAGNVFSNGTQLAAGGLSSSMFRDRSTDTTSTSTLILFSNLVSSTGSNITYSGGTFTNASGASKIAICYYTILSGGTGQFQMLSAGGALSPDLAIINAVGNQYISASGVFIWAAGQGVFLYNGYSQSIAGSSTAMNIGIVMLN